MMECLACGDCCKRMSPLSPEPADGWTTEPCPLLEMHGDIAHCARYQERPGECAAHGFPARVCPIGLSVLGLSMEVPEEVQRRAYLVYLDRGGEPL